MITTTEVHIVCKENLGCCEAKDGILLRTFVVLGSRIKTLKTVPMMSKSRFTNCQTPEESVDLNGCMME